MRLACLTLAAAVLCFAAGARAAAIPLEAYLAGQSAVRATVNGQPGLFLFDTGEGVSTISPAFAAKIGCSPWGQVTGFRMTGERIDFARCDGLVFQAAGQRMTAPIAGVFDIMSLLPKDVPPLDGSLGLDLFAGRVITIEPHAHRIVIETPASLARRIRTAKPVPARLVRDAEGVALAMDAGVRTPKGLAWMELDTGNGGTIAVARHIAPLFGLDPDQKGPRSATLFLADGVQFTGRVRTPDLIMDGNIGEAFLKDWNLTLDLARGQAWLAPAR